MVLIDLQGCCGVYAEYAAFILITPFFFQIHKQQIKQFRQSQMRLSITLKAEVQSLITLNLDV